MQEFLKKMPIVPLFLSFSWLICLPLFTHCVAKRDAHGLPCNENADCWGDSMYCNTTPAEKTGKKVCLVDQSCTQSSDCTDPWMVCCVPKGASDGLRCRFDSECANTQCTQPNCTTGYICIRGGKCLDPESKACDTDCYQPATCDVSAGKCTGTSTGCTVNGDCPSGQVCKTGTCTVGTTGCTTNADCSSGQTCKSGKCETTTATTCTAPMMGQAPPCEQKKLCCALEGLQGTCLSPSECERQFTSLCTTNKQCPAGMYCSSQKCVAFSSCAGGIACPNGFRCDTNNNCIPN